METELSQILIAALHKRHIPLVIANARLSARSAAGYAKLVVVRTLLRRSHPDCRAKQQKKMANALWHWARRLK